jgi:hypothetical protein
MAKEVYRINMAPELEGCYGILNYWDEDVPTKYGDPSRPSIKITSCRGVTCENFDPVSITYRHKDSFMRIFNGGQSNLRLTSINVDIIGVVFYIKYDDAEVNGDFNEGVGMLYLDEMEGVEFTCEVEDNDGLPVDRWLIKGVDDGLDYRYAGSNRSRYRPYVTEFDRNGNIKREVTVVMKCEEDYDQGTLYDDEEEESDQILLVTEYDV